MKTILIIAPHFPPSALPPSQRVRLMVSHYTDLGWKPVVVTVDHRFREEVADQWMVELAGENFTLEVIQCMDQRKTRRFGLGDLGLRMIPSLFRNLPALVRKHQADMVLYPVPPWYIMLAGPYVKKKTGVPYCIDFIDPWVRKITRKDFKARLSQWIARKTEGYAVKNCDGIFAVSEGILNDLRSRYPLKDKPMVAVPYGAELNDYKAVRSKLVQKENCQKKILLRYIGAISDSMMRVVKVLLAALNEVHKVQPALSTEFIGTSYAGKDLVQPRMQHLIVETASSSFVLESPSRVSYREALELTGEADMLLLVGDMTPYYAASKLMGLIASQKPFFACLHQDSFPAVFLRQLNYPFVVEYTSEEGNLPENRQSAIEHKILELINGLPGFKPVSPDNPVFLQHTAWGMTKTFVDTFQKITA